MAASRPLFSCESKRSSAYSEDLRWRMIYQRVALRLSYEEIAKNLNVDPSTAWRTVSLFNETGYVTKKKYNSANLPRKLTDVVQFLLLQLILERPGIYLRELQAEVLSVMGLEVAACTICQFFHAQGFTRQKMQLVAKQRDEDLRMTFTAEVSIYTADMFIFIDETGADRRNALRRYAYSWRGKPAKAHKLLVRGEHVTAMCLMCSSGILDCKTVSGGVDGDTFYDFVQSNLLPHLMPFNGSNPQSVVVLDNASIHHVDGIISMIQEVGALVLFLPPYSPDYNPIEEAFGKVKVILKSYEMEMEFEELDIVDLVYAAISHITPEDCIGWISDAGIYKFVQ